MEKESRKIDLIRSDFHISMGHFNPIMWAQPSSMRSISLFLSSRINTFVPANYHEH